MRPASSPYVVVLPYGIPEQSLPHALLERRSLWCQPQVEQLELAGEVGLELADHVGEHPVVEPPLLLGSGPVRAGFEADEPQPGRISC